MDWGQMRWIAVISWWEIGWSFFFNFPDLEKGFSFKTSVSLSSLAVKGVTRPSSEYSGCSLSVKRLFVFSSNQSIRLRANALIHPEDDCLISPLHWGFFFFFLMGMQIKKIRIFCHGKQYQHNSTQWNLRTKVIVNKFVTDLLKSLKDISGNGISEDIANVIGRADMKTSRYINIGICVNNRAHGDPVTNRERVNA